jgi:uncharacterized protein YecE (DUF72 family)
MGPTPDRLLTDMTQLLPGCVLDNAPGPKYVRTLRFAELHLKPPLPRRSTLRRWRHEAPDDLIFALRAPANAVVSRRGPLRFDDELKRGFEWTMEAAEAVRAEAVVFVTPVSLTPGRRDRDRLAAFRERFPKTENRTWVWAPSGLWNAESAYPLARKLGLVCAVDPLDGGLPGGDVAYARITGLGIRARLSEPALRDVLETLIRAAYDKAFVSIDSDRSFQQASLLQKLARERSESPP